MKINIYFLLMILFLICVINVCMVIDFGGSDEKVNVVSVNSGKVSDKKIEWGLKKNKDHVQPDLGSERLKLLEDNNGIAIGNSMDKYLYLTFDQGYEAGYTEKILEVLKEKNVTATFFITAHYLNTQEELVGKMIENGNIVGNHTCNHFSMPDISDEKIKEEVMNLHMSVYEKFNYEMKFIRPPKGEFSERTLCVSNGLGYKTVMWSLAYEDWDEKKQPDEQVAKKRILDNIHNGAIILLHGNSKTNANILSDVIDEAINMGYEFRSIENFVK